MRSSLNPVKAINVFLSGSNEKYNFEDEEIALMCASHYGQDIHKKVIDKILGKIGLTQENLLCRGGSWCANLGRDEGFKKI